MASKTTLPAGTALEAKQTVIGQKPNGRWQRGWQIDLVDETLRTLHTVKAASKADAVRQMRADIESQVNFGDVTAEFSAGAYGTIVVEHTYGAWIYRIFRANGKCSGTSCYGDAPLSEVLSAAQRHANQLAEDCALAA